MCVGMCVGMIGTVHHVCVCSLIPPPSTHLRVGFCATPGSTATGITEEEVNVEPMAFLPCLPGALDTLLLTVTDCYWQKCIHLELRCVWTAGYLKRASTLGVSGVISLVFCFLFLFQTDRAVFLKKKKNHNSSSCSFSSGSRALTW